MLLDVYKAALKSYLVTLSGTFPLTDIDMNNSNTCEPLLVMKNEMKSSLFS